MIKRIKFTRTSTVTEEGSADLVLPKDFTDAEIHALIASEDFKRFVITDRSYGDLNYNYEVLDVKVH